MFTMVSFFVVSTLIQALNECKTFDLSVLQAYHQLLHSKKGIWTMGRLRHSASLCCPCSLDGFIQSKQVDKAVQFS